MFGLEEISSKVVQWDRMEQLAGGGNQTSLKKNSYMTKLIFWESEYLINIFKKKKKISCRMLIKYPDSQNMSFVI